MRPLVAVIIPFYQKESGILVRCLLSLIRQTGNMRLRVVIVDDASPVTAASEVALCPGLSRIELTVIRQANGGPGSARNAGLDLLQGGDTAFVAFLDSDDEWAEQHIESAVSVLEAGYDFYFSNFFQVGASVPAFERAGRIALSEHQRLPMGSHFYAFRGDMVRQIVTGNIIGTPTVVFSFSTFHDIRFRTEYRRAGEDYLCWLEFARRGARIAFSAHPEVHCGRGVNIFSGAGWGTDGHLERLFDEYQFTQAMLLEFVTGKQLQTAVRRRLWQLRRAMVRALAHDLRHGKALPRARLWEHLKNDPFFFLAVPGEIIRTVTARGLPRPAGK